MKCNSCGMDGRAVLITVTVDTGKGCHDEKWCLSCVKEAMEEGYG